MTPIRSLSLLLLLFVPSPFGCITVSTAITATKSPPPPSPYHIHQKRKEDWELVKLTDAAENDGAYCLDGSPGAYYIRHGRPRRGRRPTTSKMMTDVVGSVYDSERELKEEDEEEEEEDETRLRKDWLIFHEGGGWCNGNDNCYDRSQTDLGSSTNYPTIIDLHHTEANALFNSKTFANFTIVYAKYCDGSSWTGDVDTPIEVTAKGEGKKKKHKIYYRGRRLLDALFIDLLTNQGLNEAERVMYGGCSAGALTSYLHIDYIKDTYVPHHAKVVGLADAMYSLHHRAYDNKTNYYTEQMTWGYEAWNSSHSINQNCLEHYETEEQKGMGWMCMHGAVAIQYVETPMLIVNSKYDTWQRAGVLHLNETDCPGLVTHSGKVELCKNTSNVSIAEKEFWFQYGRDTVDTLRKDVPARHGAFITNCPYHCLTGYGWHYPANPGMILGKKVESWFKVAMENVGNREWKSPRWIAGEDDSCLPTSVA